jgi:hypothetical protein
MSNKNGGRAAALKPSAAVPPAPNGNGSTDADSRALDGGQVQGQSKDEGSKTNLARRLESMTHIVKALDEVILALFVLCWTAISVGTILLKKLGVMA